MLQSEIARLKQSVADTAATMEAQGVEADGLRDQVREKDTALHRAHLQQQKLADEKAALVKALDTAELRAQQLVAANRQLEEDQVLHNNNSSSASTVTRSIDAEKAEHQQTLLQQQAEELTRLQGLVAQLKAEVAKSKAAATAAQNDADAAAQQADDSAKKMEDETRRCNKLSETLKRRDEHIAALERQQQQQQALAEDGNSSKPATSAALTEVELAAQLRSAQSSSRMLGAQVEALRAELTARDKADAEQLEQQRRADAERAKRREETVAEAAALRRRVSELQDGSEAQAAALERARLDAEEAERRRKAALQRMQDEHAESSRRAAADREQLQRRVQELDGSSARLLDESERQRADLQQRLADATAARQGMEQEVGRLKDRVGSLVKAAEQQQPDDVLSNSSSMATESQLQDEHAVQTKLRERLAAAASSSRVLHAELAGVKEELAAAQDTIATEQGKAQRAADSLHALREAEKKSAETIARLEREADAARRAAAAEREKAVGEERAKGAALLDEEQQTRRKAEDKARAADIEQQKQWRDKQQKLEEELEQHRKNLIDLETDLAAAQRKAATLQKQLDHHQQQQQTAADEITTDLLTSSSSNNNNNGQKLADANKALRVQVAALTEELRQVKLDAELDSERHKALSAHEKQHMQSRLDRLSADLGERNNMLTRDIEEQRAAAAAAASEAHSLRLEVDTLRRRLKELETGVKQRDARIASLVAAAEAPDEATSASGGGSGQPPPAASDALSAANRVLRSEVASLREDVKAAGDSLEREREQRAAEQQQQRAAAERERDELKEKIAGLEKRVAELMEEAELLEKQDSASAAPAPAPTPAGTGTGVGAGAVGGGMAPGPAAAVAAAARRARAGSRVKHNPIEATGEAGHVVVEMSDPLQYKDTEEERQQQEAERMKLIDAAVATAVAAERRDAADALQAATTKAAEELNAEKARAEFAAAKLKLDADREREAALGNASRSAAEQIVARDERIAELTRLLQAERGDRAANVLFWQLHHLLAEQERDRVSVMSAADSFFTSAASDRDVQAMRFELLRVQTLLDVEVRDQAVSATAAVPVPSRPLGPLVLRHAQHLTAAAPPSEGAAASDGETTTHIPLICIAGDCNVCSKCVVASSSSSSSTAPVSSALSNNIGKMKLRGRYAQALAMVDELLFAN